MDVNIPEEIHEKLKIIEKETGFSKDAAAQLRIIHSKKQ